MAFDAGIDETDYAQDYVLEGDTGYVNPLRWLSPIPDGMNPDGMNPDGSWDHSKKK